jgi:hypothetical protein
VFSNIKAAKMLGWTSLAVGATELVATRRLEEIMGVDGHAPLIRSYGVREILAGLTLLNQPGLNKTMVGGLWGRVAGDVVDIVTLGAAVKKTRRPTGLAAITAVVLGVTGLDLLVATIAQYDLVRASSISSQAKARAKLSGFSGDGASRFESAGITN